MHDIMSDLNCQKKLIEVSTYLTKVSTLTCETIIQGNIKVAISHKYRY